jgi:aminoglycoside phosphotransferase (APT) family kinase protein
MTTMSADRKDIDVALVRRLINTQFPHWSNLSIRPCETGGWDNRTFHLGDQMTVRLPSAERYVVQVEKEHRWLPKLGPLLPLPIPVPLALGAPDREYPWPWSVYPWLHGETASPERVADLPRLAGELAQFLIALQRIDIAGGPPAGLHNFFRGGPLATYDRETQQAIETLDDGLDTAEVTAVWEAALATTWSRAPVWVHGDVAAGNLLVETGRLSAVIDFGCCGVGDPACDLSIAWSLLGGESREAFRAALPLDSATWARGRGWALWKALITWVAHRDHSLEAAPARRIIDEVLADHRRGA